MLKIDLHVHTWYSDSRASVREVIEAAKNRELDGIAITDHETIAGAVEAMKIKGKLIIIPGEEVKTKHGEILALGINRVIPKGLPIMEAIRRIHAQKGLVVLPHPTVPLLSRLREKDMRGLPIDGLEVFSSITPLSGYFFRKNVELAHRLGLPMTAGSDSHFMETVGDAYTIINSESRNLNVILCSIRLGQTLVGCSPSRLIFKARMLSLPPILKRRL